MKQKKSAAIAAAAAITFKQPSLQLLILLGYRSGPVCVLAHLLLRNKME